MVTAQGKSQHVADNGYFDHSYGDIDAFSLMEQLYNTHISGENIIFSSETFCNNGYTIGGAQKLANKFFELWKSSPGHNANMLRSNFKEFGFGIAYGKYDGFDVIFGTQHFKY